jgi:acyl carrier protein
VPNANCLTARVFKRSEKYNMTKELALNMIAESLKEMKESGMVWKDINVDSETILLGKESPLDSVGFMAFLTALEEKIMAEIKRDLYLALDNVSEFNINSPRMSVNDLATYIVKLCAEE